jgi:hypothetical protein
VQSYFFIYLILLLANSVFASLSLSRDERPLALPELDLAERCSSSISFLSTSERFTSFFDDDVGVCGAGVEEDEEEETGRGGRDDDDAKTTGLIEEEEEAAAVAAGASDFGVDTTGNDSLAVSAISLVVVYIDALSIETKFSLPEGAS